MVCCDADRVVKFADSFSNNNYFTASNPTLPLPLEIHKTNTL